MKLVKYNIKNVCGSIVFVRTFENSETPNVIKYLLRYTNQCCKRDEKQVARFRTNVIK